MVQTRWKGLAVLSLLAASAAFAACDDGGLPSDTTTTTTTGTGGGGQGGTGGAGGVGGTGGGAPDCYLNPTTHEEIINACTDAEKIDKKPVLPLLNPDGSLPALP